MNNELQHQQKEIHARNFSIWRRQNTKGLRAVCALAIAPHPMCNDTGQAQPTAAAFPGLTSTQHHIYVTTFTSVAHKQQQGSSFLHHSLLAQPASPFQLCRAHPLPGQGAKQDNAMHFILAWTLLSSCCQKEMVTGPAVDCLRAWGLPATFRSW